MKINDIVNEMAVPHPEHLDKTYYHGTSKAEFARGIFSDGFIKPIVIAGRNDRGMLKPVEGKVYLTSDLSYALIYAIGGAMIGHDVPASWKGSYGYLFTISGNWLKDIQPDEDSIGELLYKREINWLNSMAHRYIADSSMKKVYNGEYSYWAKAGKVLLKRMDDWQKIAIINSGGHIAHGGEIPFLECWRILKDEAINLEPDGSNFFQYAHKVTSLDEII